jgi:hypothetical protein
MTYIIFVKLLLINAVWHLASDFWHLKWYKTNIGRTAPSHPPNIITSKNIGEAKYHNSSTQSRGQTWR